MDQEIILKKSCLMIHHILLIHLSEIPTLKLAAYVHRTLLLIKVKEGCIRLAVIYENLTHLVISSIYFTFLNPMK